MRNLFNPNNPRKIAVLLIIGTSILRLFFAANSGLGTGEAYYARGVLSPALSYFDQPPLFFWIGSISTKVFGINHLGLRIASVLFFAGTSWFLYKSAESIFNSRSGLYAVILLNLSFVFTYATAIWFQPDAPLMFFWMLGVYLAIRIFLKEDHQSMGNWGFLGLVLGIGMLSKYHMVFLPIAVLTFLIVKRQLKKWIFLPGPYVALIIAVTLLSPVFIWNYQNDWISFAFQGSRAGGTDLSPLRFMGSIGGQMVWLAPWIGLPLLVSFWGLFKRRNERERLFLLCLASFPIIFFSLIPLWRDIGFHFHWQAPGYLILFISLGHWCDRKMNTGNWNLVNRFIRGSIIATSSCVVILVAHTEFGILRPILPDNIKKNDPTLEGFDLAGIREVFEENRWLDDPNLFVASERWWQAGKIDWALNLKKDVLVFHYDPRNYLFYIDPIKLLGKDAIVVRYQFDYGISDNIHPFFESWERLDPIEVKRNGEVLLVLDVFYCRGFKKPDTPMPRVPLYNQLSKY